LTKSRPCAGFFVCAGRHDSPVPYTLTK